MIRRHTVVTVVVLLLTWAVAGLANAGGFIMGEAPTAVGVAAALLAVCSWLAAGWFAGSRSEAYLVRFATMFWTVVVAVPFLVFWVLDASPGVDATPGGFVFPLLLFVLMTPLYGLYALLPPWEPVVQGAAIGAAIFAVTRIAYFAGRRIRGR